MIRDPAYAEATAGQVGDRRNLGLVKANSALWRLGRSNELLDRFEDHREFLVVFLLKGFDLASEIAIRVHEPAQLHECAHDGDVDLHCAGAAQYT